MGIILSFFFSFKQYAINFHRIIGQTVHFLYIDKRNIKGYAKYKY